MGGPLQGRGTGTRRPGEELRPGELRTAGKGVDAARKLGQGAGHAPGGQASQDGTGGQITGGLGNMRVNKIGVSNPIILIMLSHIHNTANLT